MKSKKGMERMSLVKCKACGKEISTEARICPHCGQPSEQQQKIQRVQDVNVQSNRVGCVVVGVIMMIIGFVIFMSQFK